MYITRVGGQDHGGRRASPSVDPFTPRVEITLAGGSRSLVCVHRVCIFPLRVSFSCFPSPCMRFPCYLRDELARSSRRRFLSSDIRDPGPLFHREKCDSQITSAERRGFVTCDACLGPRIHSGDAYLSITVGPLLSVKFGEQFHSRWIGGKRPSLLHPS